MIVKIQVSTFTNEKDRQMLIYDKSRKYQYQAALTKEVEKMMGGRLKAYYAAKINGTEIDILEEMNEQDW